MPNYFAPGVYMEEVAMGSKPIAAVSTNIGGYLGRTERRPVGPRMVTSFPDFQRLYGGYLADSFVACAVEGFFRNGGQSCFIGKIAGSDADTAAEQLTAGTTEVVRLEAIGPGGWGNRVQLTVENASMSNLEGSPPENPERFKLVLKYWQTSDFTAEPALEEEFGKLSPLPPSADSFEKRINDVSNLITIGRLKNLEDRPDNQTIQPSSGHVAGIYARTDTERGIHKAPANEKVLGANGLQFQLLRADQAILNPRGVNVIRSFAGRGIGVWGARTISSDSLWKYINVRRLLIFIEESIEKGTRWVVFEPNDEKLWAQVRQTITAFLITVWRGGALMGGTPDEASFIKCDRSTMTQDDIDNGQLICVIGIAPVKPAEFIVFRIAHWTGGSTVIEQILGSHNLEEENPTN